MNKAELIDLVVERVDLPKKTATKVLDTIVEVISNQLAKGEKIILTGFGTFQVSESQARMGRNPKTGETMKIAAKKRPVFKAGKVLKDAVQ